MSRKASWSVAVLMCTIILAAPQLIQAQGDPAAGIQPFSVQAGGQYDAIDPGSGNIMLTIPVLNKEGKIPFSFNLVGNFHAFVNTANSTWVVPFPGGANGLGIPGSGGLNGMPSGGLLSYLNYTSAWSDCNGSGGANQLQETNFVFTDSTGASHPIDQRLILSIGTCINSGGTAQAIDGSGYSLTVTTTPTFVVHDRSGNTVSLTSNFGTQVSDPDGVGMTFVKAVGDVPLQLECAGHGRVVPPGCIGSLLQVFPYADDARLIG